MILKKLKPTSYKEEGFLFRPFCRVSLWWAKGMRATYHFQSLFHILLSELIYIWYLCLSVPSLGIMIEAMFMRDLMHVSLQCQNKHESLICLSRSTSRNLLSRHNIHLIVIPASCKGHSGILWHRDICQLQIVWPHSLNHRKLLFLNEQVWRANRLENFVV